MFVRTATEADLDQICALADEIALLHHTNEPTVFAQPDCARDRDFWRSCISQADGVVLLAEEGNEVHGFISAKITTTTSPSFLNERVVCRIGTIVVSAQAQRQGLGTQLIQAVERWAQSARAVEVRLEVFDFNRQAQSFYARHGYAEQSHILCKGLAH